MTQIFYPNTNWIDEMIKKHTMAHRYTLNVRGGSEKARYFVSGAYYNEDGIFKTVENNIYDTNIKVQRFNLRSNIDMEVSKTTKVGVDLAIQYLINNYPGTGTSKIFRQMLITPPYTFPAIYSDGDSCYLWTRKGFEHEESLQPAELCRLC